MKVLYIAHRHDPHDPTAGSGADHQLYTAMAENGAEVKVLGPFTNPVFVLERAYKRILKKRYTKFPLSLVLRETIALYRVERDWKPDVIFSMYPLALAFFAGRTPSVYRADATYLAAAREYTPPGDEWGTLSLRHTVWVQARALKNSTRIITHSNWCKNSITEDHGVDERKIHLFPNPAAITSALVPDRIDVEVAKRLNGTIRLLFVGRDKHRKGLDTAIGVLHELNDRGTQATLTVCGISGVSEDRIRYVGVFDKRDPTQLSEYLKLYMDAHILLHPARFDPSPIVTSEAAAFGVPTVTNDVGGIATSVEDGISGVVLPKCSSPRAYAAAIAALVQSPSKYYSLCTTTRQRYEDELNWRVGGKRLMEILEKACD